VCKNALKFSSVCEKCQKTADRRGIFFLTHTVVWWYFHWPDQFFGDVLLLAH